jgi:hypothetical protein
MQSLASTKPGAYPPDSQLAATQNDRTDTLHPAHALPHSHSHSLTHTATATLSQHAPPLRRLVRQTAVQKHHPSSHLSPDHSLVTTQNDRTDTPHPAHTLPHSHCHSLSHTATVTQPLSLYPRSAAW